MCSVQVADREMHIHCMTMYNVSVSIVIMVLKIDSCMYIKAEKVRQLIMEQSEDGTAPGPCSRPASE